ncbi:DUF262 domain-containing protein [Aeromonas veronii]|uniref:DUF262 domain-containing protein n=1 Tax=Aeromonas veronii TaxID=654 RepID=UPI002B484050|nr:DUF262 domain-containing protein [Aeromonas veronii]
MTAVSVTHPHTLQYKVIKVSQLLADPTLVIPPYQRPYKWTTRHVEQLLDDLALHQEKDAYRLGTLVLYERPSQEDTGAGMRIRDIVDGQQRTITLLLILHALHNEKLAAVTAPNLREQLNTLKSSMIHPDFTNTVSQHNIRENYQVIRRRVVRADFDEKQIDFLLNRCELVQVTLFDISEAFQFFDSQNARGRDLAPHDLLKAFHLREFSALDEPLKNATVSGWENSNGDVLEALFGEHLYRIRRWITGKPARYFGKDDVALFKGVNLANSEAFPCISALRIVHNKVDELHMAFPFQLDQTIINGRRFFEMIKHYQGLTFLFNGSALMERYKLEGYAREILMVLADYQGRHRTGDRYVRTMFDCLLLYYFDKFGATHLSKAIEKIFIWAYALRLDMYSVQLASMDNYVVGRQNMFKVLREATNPQLFLQYEVPTVTKVNGTKIDELKALFDKMGYLDER